MTIGVVFEGGTHIYAFSPDEVALDSAPTS